MDCHISQLSAESRIHVEEGDVHLRISDVNPIKISIDANEIIPGEEDYFYSIFKESERLKNTLNIKVAV